MRGQERELILLRSENGENWKEHLYDCKTDDLNQLLNGMDEGKDCFSLPNYSVKNLSYSGRYWKACHPGTYSVVKSSYV